MEKEIKLSKVAYKELVSQIMNLIVLIALIYAEIKFKCKIWMYVPVIVATIVILVMIELTCVEIVRKRREIKKAKIRCYTWDEYKEGTSFKRIYADPDIYVEVEAEAYDAFNEIYNNEDKKKRLICSTFHVDINEG